MKKLFIAFLSMMVLLFVGVASVSAHQGHSSCKDFGIGTANLALQGVIGENTSTLATSGPNAVSEDNATFHPIFCVPK